MIKLGNFPRLELKSQKQALIGQIKEFLRKKWLKNDKGIKVGLFPEEDKWLKMTGLPLTSNKGTSQNKPNQIQDLSDSYLVLDVLAGYGYSTSPQYITLKYQLITKKVKKNKVLQPQLTLGEMIDQATFNYQ